MRPISNVWIPNTNTLQKSYQKHSSSTHWNTPRPNQPEALSSKETESLHTKTRIMQQHQAHTYTMQRNNSMPFNPLMKSVGEKPNLWPSVILSISIMKIHLLFSTCIFRVYHQYADPHWFFVRKLPCWVFNYSFFFLFFLSTLHALQTSLR